MSKKSKKHVVIPGDGDPCPRCGKPTQIREHDFLRPKHLAQPFYYSRWFKCENPRCRTNQIMPERFKIMRDDRVVWEEDRRYG